MSGGDGVWTATVERQPGATARWYLEARLRGVRISHSIDRPCDTFESTKGCIMRDVGTVAFDIEDERLHVWAASDCNATDLSSLIAWACRLVDRDLVREDPRRCVRNGCHQYWKHFPAGVFSSSPTIAALVAYQVTVEDLRAEQHVEVPEDASALAHEVDQYYVEELRRAQEEP